MYNIKEDSPREIKIKKKILREIMYAIKQMKDITQS